MPIKIQELIARLEADGWFQVRQKGRKSSAVPPPVQARDGHGGREAESGSAAWNSEQHPQASGLEEVKSGMEYLVVIEEGATSFGAYVPDLPGCVAVGATRDEVRTLIQEAIEFQIEGLRADGQPVPAPSSTGQLVSVDA